MPDRSILRSAYQEHTYSAKECLPRICAIGSIPTQAARRRRIVSNGTDTRHARAEADASDLVLWISFAFSDLHGSSAKASSPAAFS